MPSKNQAAQTRASVEKDLRADGARCTLYFDGGLVDAATGAKTSAPRSVNLWALLGSYSAFLVDGKRVQQGDIKVLVADKSLAGLDVAPLASVMDEQASSGFWLYLPADPERFPEAIDPPAPGDRRLSVVRLDGTVHEGGYPVLRVLQCRG